MRFLSQLFNRTFWLSENELNRSHRTRPMFDFVRFTAAHGVSRAALAHSKPTNTELTLTPVEFWRVQSLSGHAKAYDISYGTDI